MLGTNLLLRQIHPNFVQQGRVTSQAFKPTPKDESHLSAYDGNLIEPEPAWRHYTEQLGLLSVGVLGVSREECSTLGLVVVPDPGLFPEHVQIDFSAHTKADVEAKAKILRHKAHARGWLYPVDGLLRSS
ncbi:MAG: hypothetical protein WDA75_00140 [Candidatus Latescibacterota bacterium]|jgi:hypothetical protein